MRTRPTSTSFLTQGLDECGATICLAAFKLVSHVLDKGGYVRSVHKSANTPLFEYSNQYRGALGWKRQGCGSSLGLLKYMAWGYRKHRIEGKKWQTIFPSSQQTCFWDILRAYWTTIWFKVCNPKKSSAYARKQPRHVLAWYWNQRWSWNVIESSRDRQTKRVLDSENGTKWSETKCRSWWKSHSEVGDQNNERWWQWRH